jgi:hypothetical protein
MKARWPLLLIAALAVCQTASGQQQLQEQQNAPAVQQAGPQNAAQQQAAPQANASNPSNKVEPYLGVGVVTLPPSLASHLPNAISHGQGILVAAVGPNSPAEKAGLKRDDILLSYNDQQLYSPEQFMKLVRNDRPGHEVTLGVVRGGQPGQIRVSLGERQVNEWRTRQHTFRMPFMNRHPMIGQTIRSGIQQGLNQAGQNEQAQNQQEPWLSFDEMVLTRVDKDHFKAQIKYKDDQGKMETRTFQGTRDEIRKAIDEQKDLPDAERHELRQALSLSRHPFEFEFPGVFFDPDEQDDNGDFAQPEQYD